MDFQQILSKTVGFLMGLFQVVYWYIEALYRQFVPPSMKSIDGEVILVTGASGGIGKEICKHLVKSGSNIKLVIWDLNLNDLKKLAGELKTLGGSGSGLQVFPYQVDISTRENIEECCQKVKNEVGPITIVFNNAGIAPQGNFLQLTNDQVEKTFQVNLFSHLWILRQVLPDMVAKNHGRIVNICSMGGLKAVTHALPYFSSKFAVNGYTESLKAELALFQMDGVHCSTVYPYFVQTPLIKSLSLDKDNKGMLPGAFQKFMTPEQVAIKCVDGMRREYEYIYCPGMIPIICLIDYFIPNKFRKHFVKSHVASFTFKDPQEQKLFETPLTNKQEISGKGKKTK